MAEKITRKVPIQWVQTIKDDGTYEFTPDSNVYSTQKNVPSTSKIDFQNILINSTDPTNPLSSSYATSASFAITSLFSTTASFATTMDTSRDGSLNPRTVAVSVANGTSITGPGGATQPKISTEITIPANTFSTNCIIEMVWMSIRLSGAVGTIQSAVYLSTSSGSLGGSPTVGSTLIATGANVASTNTIVKNVRDLNKQSTSGTVTNAASQYANDYSAQTTISSFTIDNTNELYFQFCISSTGASDTSCIKNVRMTEYKSIENI